MSRFRIAAEYRPYDGVVLMLASDSIHRILGRWAHVLQDQVSAVESVTYYVGPHALCRGHAPLSKFQFLALCNSLRHLLYLVNSQILHCIIIGVIKDVS